MCECRVSAVYSKNHGLNTNKVQFMNLAVYRKTRRILPLKLSFLYIPEPIRLLIHVFDPEAIFVVSALARLYNKCRHQI